MLSTPEVVVVPAAPVLKIYKPIVLAAVDEAEVIIKFECKELVAVTKTLSLVRTPVAVHCTPTVVVAAIVLLPKVHTP